VLACLPGFLGDTEAPEWRGLARSADNARAILRTGDLAHLGRNAPKSRAFVRNLLGDEAPVTVDTWAARIAGVPYPRTARQYEAIARAYVEAAAYLDTSPALVQARTWEWAQARGGANLAKLEAP
jgi:hypothetical protein